MSGFNDYTSQDGDRLRPDDFQPGEPAVILTVSHVGEVDYNKKDIDPSERKKDKIRPTLKFEESFKDPETGEDCDRFLSLNATQIEVLTTAIPESRMDVNKVVGAKVALSYARVKIGGKRQATIKLEVVERPQSKPADEDDFNDAF